MNKLKVFLQKPWKRTDSPYYMYLRENPPSNVIYMNANEFELIQKKGNFKFNNFLKSRIKKVLRRIPFLPNAHHTPRAEKYDLIHCAHCLSLNKHPWVCDIEYVNQFWAGGLANKNKKWISKILLSENCKKILAWTKWSADGVLEYFPEVKDKLEIVYPAIPSAKIKKNKHDGINLLFLSRRFYFKGGLHALEVMDRLTKKYSNVNGIVISDIPSEVLDRYKNNKKIKFHSLMPKDKIFDEIYPISDIFVYPSYTDTFGFPILESMSFGIPVVSVGGHSRGELIEEGKRGFVIKEPKSWNTDDLENLKKLSGTIDELTAKTEDLIKDSKLRKKMSDECIKAVKTGQFSVKERNKRLKKIYREAIK